LCACAIMNIIRSGDCHIPPPPPPPTA
jgi:hypothetical protein